jgi:hypothetical protein
MKSAVQAAHTQENPPAASIAGNGANGDAGIGEEQLQVQVEAAVEAISPKTAAEVALGVLRNKLSQEEIALVQRPGGLDDCNVKVIEGSIFDVDWWRDASGLIMHFFILASFCPFILVFRSGEEGDGAGGATAGVY